MKRTSASNRAGSAAAAAAVLLFASCASDESCPRAAPAGSDCPDLDFRGNVYREWRAVDPPRILQEVGNATYPACNDADSCDDRDLEGFGATDVWLVGGVELDQAVMGLREGTHTYVIFVRVGIDPDTLRADIDPRLLG
jgi:hypothetical protein